MKTHLSFHRLMVYAILATTAGQWVFAFEVPQAVFQQALYLERGTIDPAAAFALYEQVASDPAASAELSAQARWRAALCLERLGRTAEAAARHLALLETAPDEAQAGVLAMREAAARSLLRMTEAETASGAAPSPAAAEWIAGVQARFPRLAEQIAAERIALRRTLRGLVEPWDVRQPVQASIRIQARAGAADPAQARSTWRTQTDAAGRFAIELPVGTYEIRVGAPAYERAYLTAVLTPEEEEPPEIRCVLPRIPLPTRVERVEVVGNFLGGWEEGLPLVQVGPGLWELRHRLGPGVHQYKFRINGESHLITDVAAAAFAADSHEGFNARLELDREQEVVFRFNENDPHFRRTATERISD